VDNQDDKSALGMMVKEARKRRKWTLTELSERCGISPSALSKIERNRLSPTYSNIVRLARGLDISTSELFGGGGEIGAAESRFSIMHVDEGDIVDTSNYVHNYLHMRLPARTMTPLIVEQRARTLEEFGPKVSHNGEEFTYVLSGIVEVHVGNNPPTRLSPGESIYFDSNTPHAYLAASRTPCVTLSVCSDLNQAELARLFAAQNKVDNSMDA
jgi:transcriptional regulator with XRE-family HTH domain